MGRGSDRRPPFSRPHAQSLERTIRVFTRRYFYVLTKPSIAIFAQEMEEAEWNLVWVQLFGWMTVLGILGLLTILIASFVLGIIGRFDVTILSSILGLTFFLALFIPLLLFVSTVLTYLTARALGGRGTLLAQSYTSLLFQIPLSTIVSVVTLIPTVGIFLGALFGFGAFIYGLVLQIFVVVAVQRVEARTAITAVFFPALIGLLLACCLIALILANFSSTTMIPKPFLDFYQFSLL